mmetsp:Transcript_41377/g.95208  ORF Transcript_41377/g.95208 Transcript_41377/m.95208 type:complete len:201 (+) Transcript_41377:1175-1777(+)
MVSLPLFATTIAVELLAAAVSAGAASGNGASSYTSSAASSHGAAAGSASARGREGRAAFSAGSGSGTSDAAMGSMDMSEVVKRPARLGGKTTSKHELFLPQSWRRNTSNPGQRRSPEILLAMATGSPSPSSAGNKGTGLENASLAARAARCMRTSPLNTSERSSAICKWLSSKPLAPPASNAAAMRRNIGSLCSSASRLC